MLIILALVILVASLYLILTNPENKSDKDKKSISMINCPACGRTLSSMAVSCPGCGHPIAKRSTSSNSTNKGKR